MKTNPVPVIDRRPELEYEDGTMKDLREAIVEAIETLTEALAGIEDDDEGEMESEDGAEGEMPEGESEDASPPPALAAALRRRG